MQEQHGVDREPRERDAREGKRRQEPAPRRAGVPASPACASVKTTASRLATPAPRRTASAAGREASSARARRAVAAASAPAIEVHTQTTKTAAAASSAPSAATDHDAPATTADAAVIAPRITATTTRFAARPEWSS